MKLDKIPLPLIQDAASRHGIDEALLVGIISVESAFNPWACRYEIGYRWLYFAREHASRQGITYETEEVLQKCSYGLMQIMGAVAREHGFDGPLGLLFDPYFNLEYGCRHLHRFLKKYPDLSDVIASYNAGSPRKTEAGFYGNQAYVNKVSAAIREYRSIQKT